MERLPVTLLILCSLLSLIYANSTKECRHCKPGFYISRKCTDDHDTVCSPCQLGQFSPSHNLDLSCTVCSNCSDGFYVLKECTPSHDVVCESCSVKSDSLESSYFSSCVHGFLPIQSDDSVPLPESEDTVGLLNSEGSGDDVALEEGSGILFPVIDDAFTNLTVSTTEKTASLPPKEEVDDSLLPVTTIKPFVTDSTYQKSTNISENVIPTSTENIVTLKVGEGIVLNKSLRTEYIVKKPETTAGTTVTPSNNRTGLSQVDSEKTTAALPPKNTINFWIEGSTKGTPEPYLPIEEGGDEPLDYRIDVVIDDENRAVAGASKSQAEKEESGKVTVGVVVAVAIVAAVVFFILGFIASRYCRRRRRSFNVEKSLRENGSASKEGTIEFKDPEKPNVGIYDEISPEKKPNGKTPDMDHRSRDPAKPPSGDDCEYTKPIKRTNATPVSAPVPPKTADGHLWSDRVIVRRPSTGSLVISSRLSEIKYIDETTDDEGDHSAPTDRLLQKEAGAVVERSPDEPRPVVSEMVNGATGSSVPSGDTPGIYKGEGTDESLKDSEGKADEEEEEEEVGGEKTPMLNNSSNSMTGTDIKT